MLPALLERRILPDLVVAIELTAGRELFPRRAPEAAPPGAACG